MNYIEKTNDYAIEQWNLIANIGFQDRLSFQMKKKLRVCNAITFLALLFCLPASISLALMGDYMATSFVLVSEVLILFTYYFNEKHKYEFAQLWLIVVTNVSIFPHAIYYGDQSGISYLYFTLCGTPFLVFELNRRKHIVTGVFFSIFLFCLLCIQSRWKIINFSAAVFCGEYFLTMVGLSILLHMSKIYYFITINKKEDKRMEELRRKAEIQIENAQKVIHSSDANESNDSIAQILKHQIEELEVSKRELKESNEQLVKINKRMDGFIYTTSHDLKSPFANIEALLEVIKSGTAYKNEEVKELVDMMSLSVNKFKVTVWNLTKINQFNGSFGLYNDELDLKELVEELKVNLQSQIKDTDARIILKSENVPALLFSEKNMRSILFNIVNNAIKYRSSSRKPLVEISTSVKDDYYLLEIKDNGMGIPEGSKSKVFSLFQRAHNHVEGSGIGLYIVKRIIENNDGKIELESQEGVGTTFKIYINLNHT